MAKRPISKSEVIVVFGATSAICTELLKMMAPRQPAFVLVGRSTEKLNALGSTLAGLGASIASTGNR
ncbi:MAG: hypothetical protein R3B54_05325 [Bdellovibrionota bacterium]